MRGTERTKYIRFLYWLDNNFADMVNNLSFDEIVEEYLDEIDSHIVSVDDVMVIFDSELDGFGKEISLEEFQFEDETNEGFISGE